MVLSPLVERFREISKPAGEISDAVSEWPPCEGYHNFEVVVGELDYRIRADENCHEFFKDSFVLYPGETLSQVGDELKHL